MLKDIDGHSMHVHVYIQIYHKAAQSWTKSCHAERVWYTFHVVFHVIFHLRTQSHQYFCLLQEGRRVTIST